MDSRGGPLRPLLHHRRYGGFLRIAAPLLAFGVNVHSLRHLSRGAAGRREAVKWRSGSQNPEFYGAMCIPFVFLSSPPHLRRFRAFIRPRVWRWALIPTPPTPRRFPRSPRGASGRLNLGAEPDAPRNPAGSPGAVKWRKSGYGPEF